MINTAKKNYAYSEVYAFINTIGEYYKNKIPYEVYQTIENERDRNFQFEYNINQKVDENTFSKEALAMIAGFYLKYWCQNEEEKAILRSIYENNYKIEMEQYSYNNLFKKRKIQKMEEKENINKEMMELDVKENSLWKCIIKKIKNFLVKKGE